mgnify:CR=1 FL=1
MNMTEIRKILLTLESEVFGFLVDGYEILKKQVIGSEIIYDMKHKRNSAELTVIANLKYAYIKIYRNGKICKTINF